MVKESKNLDLRAKTVEPWRLSLAHSSTFKGVSEIFDMIFPDVMELTKDGQNILLPAT